MPAEIARRWPEDVPSAFRTSVSLSATAELRNVEVLVAMLAHTDPHNRRVAAEALRFLAKDKASASVICKVDGGVAALVNVMTTNCRGEACVKDTAAGSAAVALSLLASSSVGARENVAAALMSSAAPTVAATLPGLLGSADLPGQHRAALAHLVALVADTSAGSAVLPEEGKESCTDSRYALQECNSEGRHVWDATSRPAPLPAAVAPLLDMLRCGGGGSALPLGQGTPLPPPDLTLAATSALSSLARHGGNCQVMVALGAIDVLVRLMTAPPQPKELVLSGGPALHPPYSCFPVCSASVVCSTALSLSHWLADELC